MSNRFTFTQATRQGIKPLIGLYGTSNSGKTLSALLLARGFAGPNGKVILGDTESGRGALYADMVPEGYLRCDIEPPFSPQCYTDFLDAAEAAGADAVVIDSFSHEWEGEGGVLDWAATNEDTGKKGQLVWKDPKMAHAKLVMRLMRSKTFVVVCLRAKFKSRQAKDERGRNTVIKDEFVTPIQSEDFIFELTAHAEMQPAKPGTIRLTKWSVPDLADCFPKDHDGQISIETGERIAAWANSGGAGKSKPQAVDKPALTREAAVKGIWAGVQQSYSDDRQAFQDDLISNGLMREGEKFNALPLDRLLTIAENLKVTL